jgi:hypothetical protein
MSTATNNLVKTLSEINPDDLPKYSSNAVNTATATAADTRSFFSNITWQTWLIVILILAFLGINVFAYLEKGTEATTGFFDKFIVPILKVFGYETLETTKQTVETSATGTKAGVDVVADTTTGAINTIENTAKAKNGSATTNTSTGSNKNGSMVTGQQQSTQLNINSTQPIRDQLKIEKQINELEDMQEQNLQKALDDSASANAGPRPDDSLSRIQSGGSGKAGWCFIGEDRGFRTCSEIGQNDKCMSGDIFPSQEICMNPNLRP